MLLREVEYARPATVEEAIALLSEHEGARALAGGQTLVNVMKARAASPDLLVDLADLAELRTISFSADQSALELGAMVTNTQVIASSEVEVARPILAEVAATIADVQIRNRGTDQQGEQVPVPAALASLQQCSDLRGGQKCGLLRGHLGTLHDGRGIAGERTVSAAEFFLGVYMTAVAEGELLMRISVPTRTPGTGDAMAGITLGAHGTYLVNAAAIVGPNGAQIAIGCVSSVPIRATAMEERLAGGDFSEAAVRAAAAGLGATLDPPSDVHASADYRRHLAEVSAVRAVLQAAERAKG